MVLPVDVNASAWDCTLEVVEGGGPFDKLRVSGGGTTPFDRLRVSGGAKNVADAPDPLGLSLSKPKAGGQGPSNRPVALRLGLRQIDGFPEAAAARLVAAREEGGAFADVAALRERAGLSPALVERLASADAFGSLELGRRQALWEARSLIAGPDLPLFAAAQARDEGAERAPTALPRMPLSEEVVADYQTQRLSLKAHPMAFLRASLAERGFVRACDLRSRKFRAMVQVAGVVLIRQRPGSAKGVCFITLEDETGVVNLVVWPDLKEKQRKVVMGARLMEVRGRVEYDDEVIHVIAAHMTDATHELHRLSEDLLPATIARADHVNSPLPSGKRNPRDNLHEGAEDPANTAFAPVEPRQPPGPGSRECGFHQGHPRDVRVIPRVLPKSRDFH
jgi:error-prone DNA polymerase